MTVQLPSTPLFEAALKIINTICAHARQAFFVGGAVRNLLLHKPCKDIDIVSSATPDELLKIFPGAQTAGVSFGVVIVRSGDFNFEIATMREERFYMDGRHPEKVRYTTDLQTDSMRRDFTINAMYFDTAKGEIIDFHNGITDLQKGILRTVGDADVRFKEDYLRMLRAIRFAAKYDLQIADDTWNAIKRNAHLCRELAAERVRQELDWMFEINSAARAFELLDRSGLLKIFLPEVDALHGVEQPPEFHPEGDVFVHTSLMLKRMVLPSADLAWSVILHDIGKKTCFFRDAKGIHFFGHEGKGAEMAEKILDRLRFASTRKKLISTLVRDHMRLVQVQNMRPATLRKLIGREDAPLLIELCRLDNVCSCNLIADYLYILKAFEQFDNEKILPPPAITGKDLIKMGIKPGRNFKKILDFLYEQQLSGKKIDFKSAYDLIKKHFKCIL